MLLREGVFDTTTGDDEDDAAVRGRERVERREKLERESDERRRVKRRKVKRMK